jgi:Cys-tRNA(Pro) deacylase
VIQAISTPATEWLKSQGVAFDTHQFEYVQGGGTARSSRLLGIDEHAVVKTLVFEDQDRRPLIVLMHGDCHVDTKELARLIGAQKIWSAAPAVAEALSGWPVGATNPFALKTAMPVYLESTVLELAKMYINGGGRGILVSMDPADFLRSLQPRLVRCAKEKPVLVSKAP